MGPGRWQQRRQGQGRTSDRSELGRVASAASTGRFVDVTMKSDVQLTLRDRVSLTGIGVHSGKPVTMTLHPADADHGVTFLRTHLDGGRSREIEARHDAVTDTRLCTVIGDARHASVSTIEHLMAALRGLGVDNVLVEIDGPETPIMDGSSRAFVEAIDSVGLESNGLRRRMLKILKPVRVDMGRAWAELGPLARGFRLDVEIDFESPLIGRQRKALDLTAESFRRDLSRARTFGFVKDAEKLWALGLAQGSSLDNSIGLDENRVLNPDGLRWPDEFVRHKMLDAVGDLALAGHAVQGLFRSYMGGHRLNHMIVEALLADTSNYALVEAPVRRDSGHAEVAARAAVPAFAPEVH